MMVRTLLAAAVLAVCAPGAAAAQQARHDTTPRLVVIPPTSPPKAFTGLGWSRRSTAIAAEPYVVTRVLDGSPAARAGLAAGDRILAVDGKEPAEMESLFPNLAPGRRYRLRVLRGDQQLELELVAAPPRPVATQ
jgi:C-terminal processing protease CtpA/Prc